jgi:hypothetical protein
MRRRLALVLLASFALLAPGAGPAAAHDAGYYSVPYDSVLFEHEHIGGVPTQRRATFQEWAADGYPTPRPAPTQVVRYPWASTLYAVSSFDGPVEVALLTPAQWARAGTPTPRDAGHIEGTRYYKWNTSPAIFSVAPDGVVHTLTPAQWAASGSRTPEVRVDTGYAKLPWHPAIARMVDVATGRGYPISAADWQAAGYPPASVVTRFPGDVFCRHRDSDVVWYFGPSFSGGLDPGQWAAAGYPVPESCELALLAGIGPGAP